MYPITSILTSVSKGIYDEENIPETIKIDDHEYSDENLDDDITNEQGKQVVVFL